MCSSVLETELTQPDRSSVTSVLGQFGPQKRTEVTEDRSDQGTKWMYPAQLMPLPLTVSCFSKIQIDFTFLVPAHPGGPGKGPLNACVCALTRLGDQERHLICKSLYQLPLKVLCWHIWRRKIKRQLDDPGSFGKWLLRVWDLVCSALW